MWLYTNACLFYTHPPTPGFLARHHAPQFTRVLAGLWLYTSACLFYTHPPTPGFLARHHAPQITRVLAGFWAVYNACLFYTRPPTPGFLARHHAPRSTTVWVSFYIQTPRTTNLNSIGRLVAVYKCVLILHPPANPRLFGQTPRTTVYFSVGKFLHPDFSPDTTHHKSQQYWQAGGCLQMRAYLTPARQPQAFWPDTTHHGLLQCG